MTLVVTNEGEEQMLRKIVAGGVNLHLYTNDITPAAAHTLATYTEATGGGYAEKALAAGTWGFTPGNPSSMTYPEQEFVFNGTATITLYGYFVTDEVTGILLFAERFTNGPYTMANDGDTTKVTPNFTLNSLA